MNVKAKWASYTIAIFVAGLALQLLGSYAVGLWGARIGAVKWFASSLDAITLLEDPVLRDMQTSATIVAESDKLREAEREGPQSVGALLGRYFAADEEVGRFWAWVPDDGTPATSDTRCLPALLELRGTVPVAGEWVLRCDGTAMLVTHEPTRPELVVGFALDHRYARRLQRLTNAETAVFVGGTPLASTLDSVHRSGDPPVGSAELAQTDAIEGIGFAELRLTYDDYHGFDLGGSSEPLPVASGATWYLGTRDFLDHDVTVALLVPGKFLRLGTFYNTIFMIPISIALAALMAFLVWKLVSRFSQPISALVKSAHAVSEGSFDHAVPVPDAPEMREFCQTYNTMLERLRETVDLRQQLAREVGRSEVATGVLHNVGNVLNGINVSVGLAVEALRDSRVANLEKAVEMLMAHTDDLQTFLRDDSRGQKLLPYLDKLARQLLGERKRLLEELQNLTTGVDHVKNVVRTQQAYAKSGGLTERCRLSELVDDALRLEAASLASHRIEVVREDADAEYVLVDKHKTLQILVNLFTNAKQAIGRGGRGNGRITVRSAIDDGCARIEVVDDGVGISTENLGKIFSYGFTTSRDGHGFGLHNSANAANEMGGCLRCHSDGAGLGAAFTLELPVATTVRHEAA